MTVHSAEDLAELTTTAGMRGIDALEGQPALSFSAIDKELEKEVEARGEVELDLTPAALENTNDPVRIYLHEMGMTPLLTHEGEVDIAKRIERGQLRTLKALSRSPIVIRQILDIGEDLERGIRSIQEIVVFDEEEITEEILQNRAKDTTCRIDELQKHYKRASQLAERLPTIPAKKKVREYRRCRCGLEVSLRRCLATYLLNNCWAIQRSGSGSDSKLDLLRFRGYFLSPCNPWRDSRFALSFCFRHAERCFPISCQYSRLQARQVCQRPSGRLRSRGKNARVSTPRTCSTAWQHRESMTTKDGSRIARCTLLR